MGIAHRGANILAAEQLLDFLQVLSHVVEEDCRRGTPQPVGCDLPHRHLTARRSQSQIERAGWKMAPRNIPQTQSAGWDSFTLKPS